MAKAGLGTGLGALIGKGGAAGSPPTGSPFATTPAPVVPQPGDVVREVSLDRIQGSPLQPRQTFRDDQLEELAESIREHGLIQPLIVRKSAQDRWELIAGERRWRACQKAGLAKAPVIVREATDRDVLEMALVENLQREDLNAIEEARAYQRLSDEFSLRQEDIAKRVGKNRVTVANAMRLLDLDQEVQTHLARNRLSAGHAKAILGLKEQALQREAADMVIRQGLNVRATEKLVANMGNPRPKSNGSAAPAPAKTLGEPDLPPVLAQIQTRLRERLATSVRIVPGGKKGRIEIEYYGDADLGRLLELLGLPEEDF